MTEEKEKELPPLKVEITNQPKEKEEKNPTSEDTEDTEAFTITDEEIKENQEILDAQ